MPKKIKPNDIVGYAGDRTGRVCGCGRRGWVTVMPYDRRECSSVTVLVPVDDVTVIGNVSKNKIRDGVRDK